MRGRVFGPLAIAIALSAMTAGGIVITQDGGEPPADTTANLWVDTSGGTCTRQGTPAEYVNADACGSFDEAYTEASCGDTVRIKGGDYGDQGIDASQKNCSEYITFNPADGETVVHDAGGITVTQGDWIKFLADYTLNTAFPTSGYLTTNWSINDGGNAGENAGFGLQWNGSAAENGDHIWIEGLSFETFLVRGHDQVTFKNNDIGAGKTEQHDGKNWVSTAYAGSYSSNYATDFHLIGNYIHDYTPGPEAHTECLTGEFEDFLFEGNAFVNCHGNTAGIIFGQDGGFATTGTENVMRNNFVENDLNGSLHFGDTENGSVITVEFNSFEATVTDTGGTLAGTINFTGNVFSSQGLACGVGTWQYNVMAGGAVGTCDATDSSGATTFLDTPLDLHIANAATAETKVPVASCPATDIDGDTRPTGSATHCDAGADERD